MSTAPCTDATIDVIVQYALNIERIERSEADTFGRQLVDLNNASYNAAYLEPDDPPSDYTYTEIENWPWPLPPATVLGCIRCWQYNSDNAIGWETNPGWLLVQQLHDHVLQPLIERVSPFEESVHASSPSVNSPAEAKAAAAAKRLERDPQWRWGIDSHDEIGVVYA